MLFLLRLIRDLGHHWILLLGISMAVFVLFASLEVADAYFETKKRPTEDMFWCHKHGYIRKKHCLPLFPDMKKSNGEDFIVCPFCYKASVFDDVDARLK